MSNTNDGPGKPDLAAQAEAIFRDYPEVAAALRDFADKIGSLQDHVCTLDRKLDALQGASRLSAPIASD
jgi:hypothetical protein